MTQTRLHLTTTRAAAERTYALLGDVFEEDGWPVALTEIDEDRDVHRVDVYVEGDPSDAATRASVALREAGLEQALEQEPLPDLDWVTLSLEGLKPVRAGRFIVHGAHDRAQRRAGDLAIEIEAGQAFGTGHHGTTAGCLRMIEKVVRRRHPRNALDLGTGSAVLAIAVAQLARIPVLATDIDPVATDVARENVRLNRMQSFVHCATAKGFHHPAFRRAAPFDLIVANILARPLMQLAPAMAGHLAPGGTLILSGILDRQRRAVVAAYAGQRFRLMETIHMEGWSTLRLER